MKTISRIGASILLVGAMLLAASGSANAASPQWISVSAGQSHTCAITTNHALYCWGLNDHGQLGRMQAGERRRRHLGVGGAGQQTGAERTQAGDSAQDHRGSLW